MKRSRFSVSNFLKLWPFLIIALVSVVLLRSFARPGFPYTHDGESHLARMANFSLAAIHRHFPIRWAANLNYKFGYPVFHFNYYTPYVITLFPLQLGLDFEESFKVMIFLSLVAGGVFWYLLLSRKLGKLAGLVGALVYISAPYQLVNIFIRGSVGEIVGLGVLPALFYFLDRLIDRPSRWWFGITTLAVATLYLTHNITAIFGTPILAGFAAVLIWERKLWRRVLPVALAFALGIGMTLFFWIPALAEKEYTNMDKIEMSYEYIDHFPLLSQLIHSPWQYGFSVAGPNDGFSFELGPFHWLAALAAIALLVLEYLKQGKQKIEWQWGYFALVFLGMILFMNQATLPIWKVIPMVRYIQFPWRLLGFALLGVAALAAWLTRVKPKVGVILAIGAVVYSAWIVRPFGWFDHDIYYYLEWPFTSSIKGLNMPKWFNLEKNHRLQVGWVFILEGKAESQVWEWRTQRHRYQVRVESDQATIMERTAYFLGWEVRVDGQPIEINYEREDYPGVITYQLSKGNHQVDTRFTEQTSARQLGDKLSLVSGVVFLGALTQSWLFKNGRRRA